MVWAGVKNWSAGFAFTVSSYIVVALVTQLGRSRGALWQVPVDVLAFPLYWKTANISSSKICTLATVTALIAGAVAYGSACDDQRQVAEGAGVKDASSKACGELNATDSPPLDDDLKLCALGSSAVAAFFAYAWVVIGFRSLAMALGAAGHNAGTAIQSQAARVADVSQTADAALEVLAESAKGLIGMGGAPKSERARQLIEEEGFWDKAAQVVGKVGAPALYLATQNPYYAAAAYAAPTVWKAAKYATAYGQKRWTKDFLPWLGAQAKAAHESTKGMTGVRGGGAWSMTSRLPSTGASGRGWTVTSCAPTASRGW